MVGILTEILIFIFLYVFFWEKDKCCDKSFMSFDITNFLRGFAILIIIIMHSSGNLDVHGLSSLGGIGVSLFLILSGYGLAESYKKKGLTDFFQKKIFRICLPYALFVILVTCCKQEWDKIISLGFLLDIFCLNTSYWFISFLIYNYALFWLTKRIHNKWITIFIFGLFGGLIIMYDQRIRAEQVLAFPSGLLLSYYKDVIGKNICRKRISIILLLSVSLLGALLMFLGIKHNIYNNVTELHGLLQYKYIVAICILFLFNIFPPITSRFTTFSSNISLELYLVHFTIYRTISIPNKEQPISSILLFLFLSYAGAFFFHIFIDKINKQIQCIKKK